MKRFSTEMLFFLQGDNHLHAIDVNTVIKGAPFSCLLYSMTSKQIINMMTNIQGKEVT